MGQSPAAFSLAASPQEAGTPPPEICVLRFRARCLSSCHAYLVMQQATWEAVPKISQHFPTEPTKQTGILWGYTGDTKGKCSYTLIHFANKQIDYDRLMRLEPFGTHISARQSPTWHLDLCVHAIHHFGLVYHRCTRTTL